MKIFFFFFLDFREYQKNRLNTSLIAYSLPPPKKHFFTIICMVLNANLDGLLGICFSASEGGGESKIPSYLKLVRKVRIILEI